MPSQDSSSHTGQHSRDRGRDKDERDRMERRRRQLETKSKQLAKRAVRVAENVTLMGASRLLHLVRKLNRPIRRRIRLDED
jgi:hypothetical protein